MFSFCQRHIKQCRFKEFQEITDRLVKASHTPITEEFFLLEYVWCVYVSGFKASHISKKFSAIVKVHKIQDQDGNFQPTQLANCLPLDNLQPIYEVFKNKAKAKAIQQVKHKIASMSWNSFCREFLNDRKPGTLQRLPMLGPALSCHLARNLGNLAVVKPDVHLTRLAKHYQYNSVLEMCQMLSPNPPGITDLILFLAAVDMGTL